MTNKINPRYSPEHAKKILETRKEQARLWEINMGLKPDSRNIGKGQTAPLWKHDFIAKDGTKFSRRKRIDGVKKDGTPRPSPMAAFHKPTSGSGIRQKYHNVPKPKIMSKPPAPDLTDRIMQNEIRQYGRDIREISGKAERDMEKRIFKHDEFLMDTNYMETED